MAAEGVELMADVEDLAVMGFIEVAARLPFFLRLRRRVFAALDEQGVSLVIPVDYPGFNLRLARHARSHGRRVLYYIAPQVWAWHASRAATLARDADRIAVILPFEEAFLRENGANVEFVGHPLLDLDSESVDRLAWFVEAGLDPDRPLLALMPGSRLQEVDRHLEVFQATADLLRTERPELQVVIGVSPTLGEGAYRGARYPLARNSGQLIGQATAALVKSGTTTLETALAGTPFVVAYRMNPVSYQLARRVVRVPHIALANLVAGRRVVPEFVQNEATPGGLAEALRPLLAEGPARERMIADLRGVRARLGQGGAAERVAEMAAELLAR